MARPPSTQPTDGELAILRILWEDGPVELGRLRERLQAEKPVATTTVATMLKVMLNKGLVKRSPGTRGSLWSAAMSRKATANGLVTKLLNHIFDGSAQSLVAHLLGDGKLSPKDRRQILEMLESGHHPQAPSPGKKP